jgi:hypothetical protein
MRAMTWIMGVFGLLVGAIVTTCLFLAFSQPVDAPIIPRPEGLVCLDGNGYYKPSSGANHVMINDERCK